MVSNLIIKVQMVIIGQIKHIQITTMQLVCMLLMEGINLI